MSYHFSKTITGEWANIKDNVVESLKSEGFGVLTEIDVQATLKKKLDIDFRRYEILGACNPTFAHKALTSEANIGVMLPCNVILQESHDGKTTVSAVNPVASMQAVQNEGLADIAEEVKTRLKRVIDSL